MIHVYTCRICGMTEEHDISITEVPPPELTVLHTDAAESDEYHRAWCSSQTLTREWQFPRLNMGIMPNTNDVDRFRFKNL